MTSLTAVSPGEFRCVEVQGDLQAQVRLKRLGVCEGRKLRVVQAGDPMIVVAVGARIGISRSLASCVHVASPDAIAVGAGVPEVSHA